MAWKYLAAILELLLAFGALLGAYLLALAFAILVAFAGLERFDDGRVLPPPLAFQLGRVEQLPLLVEFVQLPLLLLLSHAIQLLLRSIHSVNQLISLHRLGNTTTHCFRPRIDPLQSLSKIFGIFHDFRDFSGLLWNFRGFYDKWLKFLGIP